MNAYGRGISYEVLSTWGNEKEARPFYAVDAEKIGEWLNVGGDIRALRLQQENSLYKAGRNIWMEANVQLALSFKNITAFGSLGNIQQSSQSFEDKLIKYYISYQPTDELSFRLGRYLPVYGLNIPQHNTFIRRNLSLGPGTERDVIDIQYNGENWNSVLGYSKSLRESGIRDEEEALHIQIQKNINDQHKIGLNYWSGEASEYKKTAMGVSGVFGWTESLYTLAEIDYLWVKDIKDTEAKSVNQFAKFGYEVVKGLHLQFVQEWSSSSLDDVKSAGLGLTWYPRPHFEFETLYTKTQSEASNNSEASNSGIEDYIYLLTHFYF